MTGQKKKMNKRSQLVGAILLLLFFSMIYRFYELQVVEASFFKEEAERLYHREQVIKAQRGNIFDRNGVSLAQEAKSYTVVALLSDKAPSRVQDPIETAKALAPILEMSESKLQELLSRDRYQVELRPGGWKIDNETMEKIKELALPGIIFLEEPKRYYPQQDFASHVIGFLNHDGEAVMGLEAHYNELLKGKEGRFAFQKDNRNQILPGGVQEVEHPEHGKDVYLTMDERIQLYVEQALDLAHEEYDTEAMTVVVSRPHTGEILAMSSRPSFNPNEYNTITNYSNHAISSTFEPGSTFKVITLAAAIEEGIYHGQDTYMSGSYQVPGGTIHDHQRGGWGEISFLEGVQRSSNVAFTIMGWEKMPKLTLYDYIYRFGFGERTGIDLPLESDGFVKSPEAAYPLDVANMTFGQGVAVTAVQQVAAMNAIANGGQLLQPYMIDRVVDPETGETIKQNQKTVKNEQVVSKETVQQVTEILETVVTEGTGQNFYIEGYSVAGKTGTAQKVGPDGKYMSGKYIHSFIGFAPKDDPELVVYVAVDSPDVDHYSQGGSIVAQIFKHVMKNSLQYLSVFPDIEEDQLQPLTIDETVLQNYTDISLMTARQKAEAEGYNVIVIGEGTEVIEQMPAEGTKMVAGDDLFLITSRSDYSTVPDMTGWTLRTALDWSNIAGMKLKVVGTGYMTEQSIETGKRMKKGETIHIKLEPKYEQDVELNTQEPSTEDDHIVEEEEKES